MDTHKVRVNNHEFLSKIGEMLKSGKHKSVTIVVRGNSMNPFLVSERDKVILTRPKRPEIGEVILAEIKPTVYALHRIIKIEGNVITMLGDGNPNWMQERFTSDKIIATAIGFIRKEKEISTKSVKWRLYTAMWMNTPAIMRRICLSIYRRIIIKLY